MDSQENNKQIPILKFRMAGGSCDPPTPVKLVFRCSNTPGSPKPQCNLDFRQIVDKKDGTKKKPTV